jgi:hypothetical protein
VVSVVDEVIDRLAALPRPPLTRRPPADPAAVDAVDRGRDLRLPADVRRLLAWSDGFGLATSPTAFDLWGVDDLRILNDDEPYRKDVPGMTLVGGDYGGGLYFLDPAGRLGRGHGAVFLVHAGSLWFPDSRHVAGSVAHAVRRALDGEDLWAEPRLGPGAGDA